MRHALLQFLIVAAFMSALVFAIGQTENTNPWLGSWFVLFIFIGLPLSLLSLRDLLVAATSGRSSVAFRAWALLHVCAVFAAGVGFLLGHLARESHHPRAELHQWLVLVLPGLVYLAPLLLALHSGSFTFLMSLSRIFRGRGSDET